MDDTPGNGSPRPTFNPHAAEPAADRTGDPGDAARKVERTLLELLVCPVRRTTLIYDAEARELISPAADLAYPIREGVPLLTPDAARPLSDADRRRHRIK